MDLCQLLLLLAGYNPPIPAQEPFGSVSAHLKFQHSLVPSLSKAKEVANAVPAFKGFLCSFVWR